MYENGRIYMGLAGDKRVEMVLKMCNRHGLISGASGTGKTVTPSGLPSARWGRSFSAGFWV